MTSGGFGAVRHFVKPKTTTADEIAADPPARCIKGTFSSPVADRIQRFDASELAPQERRIGYIGGWAVRSLRSAARR